MNCVAVTDNDTHMFSCGNDGTVAIVKRSTSQDWNAAISAANADSATLGAEDVSTDKVNMVEVGGKVWCCSVSGNRRIYLGFYDGCVASYDIDGRPVIPKFKAHTDFLRSVEICPDERLIISCSHDCFVKIWELSSDRKKVEHTKGNPNKKKNDSGLELLEPSKKIREVGINVQRAYTSICYLSAASSEAISNAINTTPSGLASLVAG